jgi:hypothetical protein
MAAKKDAAYSRLPGKNGSTGSTLRARSDDEDILLFMRQEWETTKGFQKSNPVIRKSVSLGGIGCTSSETSSARSSRRSLRCIRFAVPNFPGKEEK